MRILCLSTKFLKNKFILDLEDAEEEHSGENEIPLLAHFLHIRDALKEKDITASTPIRLKNCLYNAISALEECVVLSEKREPRKKKDGPMHGYTLAEHWLICKTRRLLVQTMRRLTATADAVIPGMTDMAASSSSTSLQVIPRPNSRNFDPHDFPGLDEQVNTILHPLRQGGKGFQEIGIVGIGGSGKTTLAQLVFTEFIRWRFGYFQSYGHYGIWICLFRKLSGNVRFKKMIKNMLKQCKAVGDYEDFDEEEQSEEAAAVDDEDYDGVEVEELLDNLGKALKGKRYLMVLDGIWDINIHWYFKLKGKLKSVSGDGHVIITSRLPRKARMMVGPHNLYHMQPALRALGYRLQFEGTLDLLEKYRWKLKYEVIEQCDGLPLAMHTLEAVIEDQILGKEAFFWGGHDLIVLTNPEDDAILGNELLLSWHTISSNENMVMDVSKLLLHDVFNKVNRHLWRSRGLSTTIIVLSGDAMANQLMQVIMQVVRNLKRDSNPPILLLPLGSKANISSSLGWENQPPRTLPKHVFEFLTEVVTKPKKNIDSWGVVMKMKSIPEGFPLPRTFRLDNALEENSQAMEADKEFHVTFWNYFIIGLNIEDLSQKKDGCCGSCSFTPWPRNIVLPIGIKTKDKQGEWTEISIPHSTRSIICVNLPCFPDRPNVKKKYRNFKDPFVDDGLLEVICFKDAWHRNDFLPSKDRGECLGQVGTIRFELYYSAVNHIHMSIDGNRWKHPLSIEDDNKVIEINHSGRTKVFVNSNSRCKFKSLDE
ncbi:uncharacterized protein LOC104878930 [Vitis vinifera]|uniref:uncharacterized protein LOC104878930 n=1 Tax=Vitis vinifera TaxID=29760 RepID=UPI0005401E4A|nr:uncharacterized protein LOC104878930 [Vitis vinifera]|eukprot:XP_010648205.1 PREDICTED: uncharacterized protein LOC104878930 [Vitis vinifera]